MKWHDADFQLLARTRDTDTWLVTQDGVTQRIDVPSKLEHAPWTEKMIQRMIDCWKEVGVGPYYESLTASEIQRHIRSAECCGDSTADCRARGEEYLAARAQGMAQLRALLETKQTLARVGR